MQTRASGSTGRAASLKARADQLLHDGAHMRPGRVLGSYAAAIAILAAVLGSSLRASVRARRELAALEARKGPRRKR